MVRNHQARSLWDLGYCMTFFFCVMVSAQPPHLSHLATQLSLTDINKTTQSDFNAPESTKKVRSKKEWTFMVYMAADNDLRGFAARNITQMATQGSNSNINIVVHLDTTIVGNKKITRRYYIEKDKMINMNPPENPNLKMDSGSPQTLTSFATWAIREYPAHNYALIMWNHGTGIIDPAPGKILNPSHLFVFNSATNKWELDRTVGFLDLMSSINYDKGICWDDSTGNFLNNQTFDAALAEIREKSLAGGKFALLGFDACLMSMVEICNIAKKHAKIMVSSQEVEMGQGWDYAKVLQAPHSRHVNPESFARHIVSSYEKTYRLGPRPNEDFTLSAVNLEQFIDLERNINDVAQMLRQALNVQKNNTVRNAIRASKNKLLCTHFDEPTYIDLHHFLSNLENNLKYFEFNDEAQGHAVVHQLRQLLPEGRLLIEQCVVANTAGKNLAKAHGLSIYFPDNKVHHSYKRTTFAHENAWAALLAEYLSY